MGWPGSNNITAPSLSASVCPLRTTRTCRSVLTVSIRRNRGPRMDEYLVLLLEPRVHLVPVERDVPLQELGGLNGFPVRPHGVLGDTFADPERPERSIAPSG